MHNIDAESDEDMPLEDLQNGQNENEFASSLSTKKEDNVLETILETTHEHETSIGDVGGSSYGGGGDHGGGGDYGGGSSYGGGGDFGGGE